MKYPPSPCYACLFVYLFVCLFVCLLVCLQGGVIAVLAALSYHEKFTGLILSSPGMYADIGSITVSQIVIATVDQIAMLNNVLQSVTTRLARLFKLLIAKDY